MKKMIFGLTLFVSGLIGLMTLMVLSVLNPCNYNGITGFRAFLLSSDTVIFFVLFCSLFLWGGFLCLKEQKNE